MEGVSGSLRRQAGAGVRQGLVSRPEPGPAGYLAAASRTELEPARPAIIRRASAIADYTDTNVFAPEVDDNGVAQPEDWFGLDPACGEDSAEEIDSSDEGEEEEEEGEDAEPAGGAADQPQPDRASSTTSRASASPATGRDPAETR